MKKLNVEQLNNVEGQGYCDTLWTILTGGNYQGDILYGWQVYADNCVNRVQ